MIILSHPTGNANVRQVGKSLAEHKLLSKFHTSIAAYPGNFWYRLSGFPILSDFRRRSFDIVLKKHTQLHPWKDLGRAVASKLNLHSLTSHERGKFSVDSIYRSLDFQVAKTLPSSKGATAVYAYEDGALESFKVAKTMGLKCIYDLPIAYYETGRALMHLEAERLPKWSRTLGGGIKDSEEKLLRKSKELELADLVIGPGSFVMDSLPDWAQNKQRLVAPFGSPQVSKDNFERIYRNKMRTKKLRVLFVGAMGQRKGLGDLFDAMKLLNGRDTELVVLGSPLAKMSFYKEQFSDFVYEPVRPHDKVLELMRTCDVLCLPSIVEGRALVMQEAMSQGLPIIITKNTGGEDLVEEGETGFLVPVGSPEAIAEKLVWFLENRQEISGMSRNSYKKSQTYTWEKYGETIINHLTRKPQDQQFSDFSL